jgi:hypothetical protein
MLCILNAFSRFALRLKRHPIELTHTYKSYTTGAEGATTVAPPHPPRCPLRLLRCVLLFDTLLRFVLVAILGGIYILDVSYKNEPK